MLRRTLKRMGWETLLRRSVRALFGRKVEADFTTSDKYWDDRYRNGGNSGAGSYGRLATFKSEVLNDFVGRNGIKSVIEFGSGDGNQLTLANYPFYQGVDVSKTAVHSCRVRFAGDLNKKFMTLAEYDGQCAELSLSLDVIYHLVEDDTYDSYMTTLFAAAERYVIVYASNMDDHTSALHVRHRKFTDWVSANQSGFKLVSHIPNRYPFEPKDQTNSSFADFFVFEAISS